VGSRRPLSRGCELREGRIVNIGKTIGSSHAPGRRGGADRSQRGWV